MDNMLDISREAFPRPTVSRLSSVLHETEAATQRGIDRAFPVSLTALAEHAKRRANAENMLGQFQKGDYPHLTPLEVSPLVTDPMRTARLAASGEGFLSRIFGAKLDEVVDLVARQAGVSRTSAHVILGLSAPLLLDALGKESEQRHFDAEELARFLDNQEENARSLLPVVVERASQAAVSGMDTVGRPIGAPEPAMKTLHGYVPPHLTPANEVTRETDVQRGQTQVAPSTPDVMRSALLLAAAVGLLALLGWLAFRAIPRPEPVPARPPKIGQTGEPVTPAETAATPAQGASSEGATASGTGTESTTEAEPALGMLPSGDQEAQETREAQTTREASPRAATQTEGAERDMNAEGAERAMNAGLAGSAGPTRREGQAETIQAEADRLSERARRQTIDSARTTQPAPFAPPAEVLSGQDAVDALAPVAQAEPAQVAESELPTVPPSESEAQREFGDLTTQAGEVAEGSAPNGIAELTPTQPTEAKPQTQMPERTRAG